MKFKKGKNVNSIEYFAQCFCEYSMASCSCTCGCTCYSPHNFQDAYDTAYNSRYDSRYISGRYAEDLAYR